MKSPEQLALEMHGEQLRLTMVGVIQNFLTMFGDRFCETIDNEKHQAVVETIISAMRGSAEALTVHEISHMFVIAKGIAKAKGTEKLFEDLE